MVGLKELWTWVLAPMFPSCVIVENLKDDNEFSFLTWKLE